MRLDKNTKAFFALIGGGLWRNSTTLGSWPQSPDFTGVDWKVVYRLAKEQSVLGLMLDGIDVLPQEQRPPRPILLQWIGEIQMIERQNKSLNDYVAWLINHLREEDVYAVLVKGQGIAQCYEKPLWRTPGDVDLLLSETNYEKAKTVLIPLAVSVEQEYISFKHIGMSMPGGRVVELHGTMHSRLSRRVDRVIDEAQDDVFFRGRVRSWMNGKTQVFLPSPDNDVIFVFTHILKHFYIEGIGLRQICDLCRLLWRYKESLNRRLLGNRIQKAGVMSEWKAFAAFAVNYLGMPIDEMPFYSLKNKWNRKAEKILKFVLESGNFGHNRQFSGGGKFVSAWRKTKDFLGHTRVFPIDSIKFLSHFIINGIRVARDTKTE